MCGENYNWRVRVQEYRLATHPQDQGLPKLVALNLWESPRGAFSHFISLPEGAFFACPHYYYKSAQEVVFVLLHPEATLREIETRRYYNPALWPAWSEESRSGVIAVQGGDHTAMYWLDGDVNDIPDWTRVPTHHQRCVEMSQWPEDRRHQIGCTRIWIAGGMPALGKKVLRVRGTDILLGLQFTWPYEEINRHKEEIDDLLEKYDLELHGSCLVREVECLAPPSDEDCPRDCEHRDKWYVLPLSKEEKS